MTNYMVSSGQTLSRITLTSGSEETVYADGKAVNSTTLNIGGAIDVVALVFPSGGPATVNTATDLLTVNEGGQTYTRQLAGTYSGNSFQLAADVSGGTLIIA